MDTLVSLIKKIAADFRTKGKYSAVFHLEKCPREGEGKGGGQKKVSREGNCSHLNETPWIHTRPA